MIPQLRQWDVVRVRIHPKDKDEHPAIVITPDEFCSDARRAVINVLYGSTRRPDMKVLADHVVLNGADGLEHPTLLSCGHFYQIARNLITGSYGRVSAERRRQIGRKIVATYRLPL